MTQLSVVAPDSLLTALRTIPGWEDVNKKDQIAVEKETRNLNEAILGYGRSRLAIGRHLLAVQAKLEPLRMFNKYLIAYNFKKSTAYEHIKAFKEAEANWSPALIDAAMQRNMSLDVHAVKRIPPPATNDQEKIAEYLDLVARTQKRLDGRSKRMAEVEIDHEVLLKQAYRFVVSRVNKLPTRGKTRRAFMDQLVGMLLSDIGVASDITFSPEAVPDGFRAEVGRPRLNVA